MSLRYSLLSTGFVLSLFLGSTLSFSINPVTAQTLRPELRSGSTGTAVRELQATLKLLNYYSGEVTGTYDEATVIAVYHFQKAAKLPETGVMDQTSWTTLFPAIANPAPTPTATNSTPTTATAPTPSTTTQNTATPAATSTQTPETLPLLKEGMSGDAVTLLQQRLKAKGFFSGVIDGVYGPQTLEAVIAAQTAFKLDGDGIVGVQTWKKLLE
jgi:N-acetylmuramoyl-L-alanine amidase